MIPKSLVKRLPLTMAFLATIAVADLPQARSQDTKPAFEMLTVKLPERLGTDSMGRHCCAAHREIDRPIY